MRKVSQREFYQLLDNNEISLDEDIYVERSISDLISNFVLSGDLPTFEGCLNGNGYKIYNPPTPIFENISETGIIKNVTVQSENEENSVFCKTNYGKILDSTVDCTFRKLHQSGSFVENNYGMLKDCTVKGEIKTSELNVSGLALINKGVIDNCTSYINITGVVGGGLVVINNGVIENSKVKNSSIVLEKCGGGISNENTGEITNCTVTDIDLHVNDNDFGEIDYNHIRCFGGVTGLSEGDIHECTVEDSFVEGRYRTGCIAGVSSGIISYCTISSNHVTTNPKENDRVKSIGGIVGRNVGTLRDSTCTDVIIQTDGKYIGGAIGDNQDNANNLVVRSISLSGGSKVGGISGHLERESAISNCISTGLVEGDEKIGGLFGTVRGDVEESISNTKVSSKESESTGAIIGEISRWGSTDNICYYERSTQLPLIGKDTQKKERDVHRYDTLSEKETLCLVNLKKE